MHAYLLSAPGQLSLGTVPDPSCGSDEVTLRTEAVSVCSTDISYFRGHLFPDAWPIIPGHEYLGRAVEVGANLRDVIREGDRVCYWGQTDFGGLADYRTIRPLFAGPDMIQETTWYTHRHFHDAHQSAAIIVPPDLPGHLATVIEPLTSVLRSLLFNAPKPGDDCVVLGAGPSGLLAVQALLRYFGARSVTVFDLDDVRLARAKAAGATTILNPGRQIPEVEGLIADYQDHYADYVFDALPHQDAHAPDARGLAMGLLRPGGDYIVYGAAGLTQSISSWMILAKGLHLKATPFDVQAFSMMRSAHVARVAMQLITRGVVDAGSVVTTRLNFDDEAGVRNAFESYGAGGGMKSSITTEALPEQETPGQAHDNDRQTSGSLL